MSGYLSGIAIIRRLLGVTGIAAAILLSTAAKVAQAQTPVPADANTTCVVASTEFASWFKSGAVTANGEVDPADSVNFPDIPNCSFYEWSEQMFLWLTSPTPPSYGGGGGRIFQSAAFFDVSPPDADGNRTLVPHKRSLLHLFNLRAAQFGPHGLPILFDKRGRMLEVLSAPIAPSGRSLLRSRAGEWVEIAEARLRPGAKPTFLDPSGKSIDFDLAENFALHLALKPRELPAAAKAELLDPRRMSLARKRELKVDQRNLVLSFKIKGKLFFLDQNGNTIDVEQGQAGTSAVLMAQNGSLVYFASMVNDVFAYLLTGTKNGDITPTPTQFPTTQSQLDQIVDFAADHGRTFPDPEALAIEVKTAWVETTNLDASKYITVNATIPTYDTSDPTVWTPNGQKNAKLAMVGMHVVGSTKGHPEMIWATFEHIDNTANAAYNYVNTANQNTNVPQNTAGTFLFTPSNSSGPFNVVRMRYQAPSIVADPGQTIGPSDTIRWKAWGAAANVAPNPLVSSAGSNTEIIAINNSVRGQLAAGDLRGNYIMTGSTWTIGGAAPNGPNEVGTSKLANTTMETYDQGTSNQAVGSTNCFTCHVTNQFPVSHFFDTLEPLFE